MDTADDPNIPRNYCPLILRLVTLGVLAFFPLIVFAITEYLFQCSIKEIGIFKPNSSQKRLVFCDVISQFFSLLVLVLGGFFFEELDLVVKTMELFYQLSRAEGADRDETLLVDYFRPLVYFTPFQVASNSH